MGIINEIVLFFYRPDVQEILLYSAIVFYIIGCIAELILVKLNQKFFYDFGILIFYGKKNIEGSPKRILTEICRFIERERRVLQSNIYERIRHLFIIQNPRLKRRIFFNEKSGNIIVRTPKRPLFYLYGTLKVTQSIDTGQVSLRYRARFSFISFLAFIPGLILLFYTYNNFFIRHNYLFGLLYFISFIIVLIIELRSIYIHKQIFKTIVEEITNIY